MGSTPRLHTQQIPMPTRSSEASSECFGRVVLSYLREEDQADASFFTLGDALHRTIEATILRDLDFDDAWTGLQGILIAARSNLSDVVIESSQRGWDTMYDDARRMLGNWFDHVHPDSAKRHPIYDDYQWPPQVEVEFHRDASSVGSRYPVWGSVDALFSSPERGNLIVDWKSGVKKPESDFQLNFYRFGLDLREAPAHYHMLDRVRKASIVVEADTYPGDLEIKEAISLTERRKDAIIKGYMPKFNPDWYCGYCPVQHVCPADGDPRNRGRNQRRLKRLLQTVEAMPTIPVEKGLDIGND